MEKIDQRGEGQNAVGREAVSLEYGESLIGGARLRLEDQARFADTGLAGDQRHLPAALARLVNQALQSSQLMCPTDEHRADNRCGACRDHTGSLVRTRLPESLTHGIRNVKGCRSWRKKTNCSVFVVTNSLRLGRLKPQ